MQRVDTLIHAGWVIPVEPRDTVLEGHSLAIHNGRIEAVLPRSEAEAAYTADAVHELGGHALIPGLVNAHTHAAMSLMRGLADDLPLMTWLKEHIWPAEGANVSHAFVDDGTRLAAAEMLRSGTTCFNDMYLFPDAAGAAAEAAGIRANLGMIVFGFPTPWASTADEYFERGIAVHDRFRDHPLITTAFSPHAPYTVPDESLARIATLAEELDVPVHIHVHETAHEVDEAVEQDGRRPLERLEALGLLGPRLQAVHATQLTDDEIGRLAENGASVVHCPQSNLKLASGFCPVAALAGAGVNLALGTDGAASNNDLDMLAEMQSAALLGKAVAGEPAALPAEAALEMATLGGARALGLEADIGSLVAGKAADLVAIDLNRVATRPLYHPVSQIVYAAGRDQVTDVWVAGRHTVSGGRLTTLDETDLLERADGWRDKLAANA